MFRPDWREPIADWWGWLEIGGGGFAIVGHGVQKFGLAHAFALVIDDDALGGAPTFEADLDGAVGQMARGFETKGFEGEGVVGADVPVSSTKKNSSLAWLGGRLTDTAAVEREPVQRGHAQDGMFLSVVLLLHPLNELTVERFQGTQVQRATQEQLAHRAEEPFDSSLRGPIPHRRVGEQAADAGTDLNDFLGGVDRAVTPATAGWRPCGARTRTSSAGARAGASAPCNGSLPATWRR